MERTDGPITIFFDEQNALNDRPGKLSPDNRFILREV
jgi:hypothetical protein